jgi:hypothetical protein
MTAWILLTVLVILFALAVRRDRRSDPTLPSGYEGERQLAELRALIASCAPTPRP